MEDELILSEQDRARLDGIVQKMSFNKESDDAIQFVVGDFKSKYGVKKKESSEVSPSKPSAKPSASVTSPSFAPKGQPTQAVPAAFGEIPKFEGYEGLFREGLFRGSLGVSYSATNTNLKFIFADFAFITRVSFASA